MSRFLVAISTAPGGGFYGVYFRESEEGGFLEIDDTLVVDSDFFYFQSNNEGKPLLSFHDTNVSGSGGGGGVSDHGLLTGLSDDDHTQYSLADGTRAFTGKVTISSGGLDVGGDISVTGHHKIVASGFYIAGGADLRPGGSDGEVQFNSNGQFGADSNLVWNADRQTLELLQAGSNTDICLGNKDTVVKAGFGMGAANLLPTIVSGGIMVIQYHASEIRPQVPIRSDTDATLNNPTYSFDADVNVGIYRPGSDQMALVAGGKELIRLTETTDPDYVNIEDRLGINLGVGTVPGSTLHVQGDGFFENGKVVAAGFYTPDGGEISAGGGGETNTASNLGGDEGIFGQKVGVDLQFKGLTAGSNITLSSDGTSITINSTASGSGGDPGFYGVIFRESDGSTVMRDDQLNFDSDHFYLSGSSDGKPLLSLIRSGVTWSESEAGGYSNSGASVVFDSDFFYLSTDGSGVPIVSLSSTIQKDITLESPTASEDVTFFHTSRALTITAVKAVLVGSSAPSVTVTVRSSTDRSAAGTANVSAQAVVNTTTAQSLPVATAAIAAGSWVWIETTALSGSIDSVSISMEME